MFQKLLGPLDSRLMNIPLKKSRECPGSPMVRTQHFDCSGLGSISAWGTKILQATQAKKKKVKQDFEQMLS